MCACMHARAGERVFVFFTPAKLGEHRLYFSCAWTLVLLVTFSYTLGEFPYYQAAQWPDAAAIACLANATASPMAYGPSQMEHWITTVCCLVSTTVSSLFI